MSDTTPELIPPPRRFHFAWVPLLFLRPRQAFAKITAQNRGVWLTPMLILSITALALVLVTGWLKQQAALAGEISLPPDYDYYTAEQQAQYMQAAQATQGPVFMYVLPGIAAILGVWFGWLLSGGLLYLVTTLLGGRNENNASLNIVAWASLPLALRDLVRAIATLINHRVIASPGISGFAPTGEGALFIFISSLFALIDLYVIWKIVLLAIGIRTASSLPVGKAVLGSILTVLFIFILQALLGVAGASLSNLTFVRPFFF